jgi:hypothetical protein
MNEDSGGLPNGGAPHPRRIGAKPEPLSGNGFLAARAYVSRMTERDDASIEMAPLEDIASEAKRIVDRANEHKISLRLMGGLAVRMHCANLSFCERPYSDIDMMGLSSESEKIYKLFEQLGYVEDREFDALHGGQRLKFQDSVNQRHVEIFLDKFRMDQTLDFRGRLAIDPYTISLSDLFVTKAQVVKMDEKDFHDLFSLFRGHKIGVTDRPGVINGKYIANLCAHDWGLYHTLLNNLERLPDFYEYFKLDKSERQSMDRRIWMLKSMIIDEPKGPLWKARDMLGEHVPYHEEVEHMPGDE